MSAEPATEKKIRLVKFGSKQCGPCRELARRRTLEKFGEKYPDVELKVWDSTEMDDAKDPANKKMDEYEVKSIPAFIWEAMDGEVLMDWEGGLTPQKLEELHEQALEELEEYETKGAKSRGKHTDEEN